MLSLPLLAGLATPVAAQGVRIDRVEIVNAGIFQAQTTGTQPAPATAAGARHILTGATLVQAATRIEARVGLHFGMQFRVIGQPQKAAVRLTSITHYPAPGLTNPVTGSTKTQGENTIAATIGPLNYRGYVFEHEWELVAGNWTFELWDGRRMLAKQAFEVVKP
jgi:hypothetical protein